MGTSAEQFALMGGVFLILGGTFVFAPQIINAVNGFLAALFRRPRKAPKAPAPAAEPARSTAPAAYQPPASEDLGTEDHEAWGPSPAQDRGAVSRLRDEISSSWGGSEPR